MGERSNMNFSPCLINIRTEELLLSKTNRSAASNFLHSTVTKIQNLRTANSVPSDNFCPVCAIKTDLLVSTFSSI